MYVTHFIIDMEVMVPVTLEMQRAKVKPPEEHSGIFFSLYSLHPETSWVQRVALKNCGNFDEFKMFWHKIDGFKVKISILTLKHLQIMKVLPVLSSIKLNSECFGKKEILRRLISNYSFHFETFEVKRVALKNC